MKTDFDTRLGNMIQARIIKKWQKDGPISKEDFEEIKVVAEIVAKGNKLLKKN